MRLFLGILIALGVSLCARADDMPIQFTDKIWYAVDCSGHAEGYQSLARQRWETLGYWFPSFASEEELKTYIRQKVEPYSNGLANDLVRRNAYAAKFYAWINGVEINKDIYKPADLPAGCDYLPVAAHILDRYLGASSSLASLSVFDQHFLFFSSDGFPYATNDSGNWLTNADRFALVGNVLSIQAAATREQFYSVFHTFSRGKRDFSECTFADSTVQYPQHCERLLDYSAVPLIADQDGNAITHGFAGAYPELLGTGEVTFFANGDVSSILLPRKKVQEPFPAEVKVRTSLAAGQEAQIPLSYGEDDRLLYDESGNLRASQVLVRDTFGALVYRGYAEVDTRDLKGKPMKYYLEGLIWKDARGKILGGQLAQEIDVPYGSYGRGYPLDYQTCSGDFVLFDEEGHVKSAPARKQIVVEGGVFNQCGGSGSYNFAANVQLTLGPGEKLLGARKGAEIYTIVSNALGDDSGDLTVFRGDAPASASPLLSYAPGACALRRQNSPESSEVTYHAEPGCAYFVRLEKR